MIEMIAGVFGLPIKNKQGKTIRIQRMGPNDGPFSATPKREAELVASGIARYVEQPTIVEGQPPVAGTGTEGAAVIPEYNADMKADQLRAIGQQFGLTFKVGMKKTEMVAALDKYFAENTADAEDEDGTDTEGDDDAPTFDPAEAVQ